MVKEINVPPLIDEIWLKTLIPTDQENDSCWIWIGNTNTGGYGQIKYKGKAFLCHRATYEYAYGSIPSKMVIRHACNEKRCVRPEHLISGNHHSNMQDRLLEQAGLPNLQRSPKFRANKIYFTDVELRFWTKVEIPEDRNPEKCWFWQGTLDGNGYGQFWFENSMRKANRVAFYLYYNEMPESYISVCHTCDERACCNPHHLWLGTHQDNMRDRTAKKRSNFDICGDKNHNAKYKESDFIEIRRLRYEEGLSNGQISELLNIPKSQIKAIILGKHRKKV